MLSKAKYWDYGNAKSSEMNRAPYTSLGRDKPGHINIDYPPRLKQGFWTPVQIAQCANNIIAVTQSANFASLIISGWRGVGGGKRGVVHIACSLLASNFKRLLCLQCQARTAALGSTGSYLRVSLFNYIFNGNQWECQINDGTRPSNFGHAAHSCSARVEKFCEVFVFRVKLSLCTHNEQSWHIRYFWIFSIKKMILLRFLLN